MQPSSPKTAPRRRRRPRQDRSRATVDAILTATEQVLVAEGYSRLTTRAIAERAGVSVGSLYQYFPSKEALLRSLSDAHRARVRAALDDAVERTCGWSLIDRAPVLLETLLRAKTQDPELAARLSAAMLEIDGPCFLTKDTEPFRELVSGLLSEHADEIRVDDPELAAFVIVRAIEGVMAGAAAGERRFDDPSLLEAMTGLVMGLLR